jgi:alkylation response protein AidB-like acyl-CoA dehydrogenase
VDFRLSEEERRLQERARALAADFALRSAEHDRDASHPIENYERLRREGFYALNIPKVLGGEGVGLLGHTLAFEALAEGCPATALAFNMHASVVMPLMKSAQVAPETKRRLADLVVNQGKLIAGNFSEPGTTSLIGARPITARARCVQGGYSITARKMFASMLEAADYCLVLAYPEGATSPHAGIMLLVPREANGRRVDANWDTLGMRATRSDALILDDCRLPECAAVFQSDDIRPFRLAHLNWFWGSYTAVYLGVAAAAYREVVALMKTRQPAGYAQSLAYQPDVRRHVAQMSADLEAARLVAYHAAWLSDSEGPTPMTTAALYRAKYLVSEAVSRITRTALTLAGAHGLFKGSRLEQLFRDGAVAPAQPPQPDFCLLNMAIYELDLDPSELLPPLKETGAALTSEPIPTGSTRLNRPF